ncbi:MAG: cytochrome c3 family protein [Bacteroidales bacterium]|jgi:hypothetical protein|nr:cytochrome c3 family protein [Bacteroidales bacterium]
MKRITLFLTVIALFIGSAVMINGCTKEGPQGPAGTNGTNGVDGINGTDGTAACSACHNFGTTVKSAVTQWEASLHATGGHFDRNGTSCAPCHTHEGFRETFATAATATAAAIENATPPNCYTCHDVHKTYTAADWTIVGNDAHPLWINGVSINLASGNNCAHCHQARIPSPTVTVGGADVVITSDRWGPHYGGQSLILYGTGGFEIAGSMAYPAAGSYVHAKDAGCVKCHMAPAYGNKAGGHTTKMSYEYNGATVQHLAGCKECHSTITTFDHNSRQTEITALKEELFNKLVEVGIGDPSHGRNKKGTFTATVAGAYLNYALVKYDASMGVHNYPYTYALLKNSLESLQ